MSSYALAQKQKQAADQPAPDLVPFLLGSNLYSEAPFFSFTVTMDGVQHQVLPVPAVTPGNYLDGVTIRISNDGSGDLGGGSLTADGVLAVLPYISFVNTNGGPILYPMGLLEYTLAQKYLRPWRGDPQQYADFSNSINPAIVVELNIGVKDTLAILSNTDARAEYRLNAYVAPADALATGATTAPTITVDGWINSWKQPPAVDYMDRPIDPFPPGIGVQRKLMAETLNMPASGTARLKLNLTGEEIRGLILIARDDTGARVDLTDANAGPITFRLDNGNQWVQLPSQIVQSMEAFYAQYFGSAIPGTGGGVNRETGVYALPRFRSPNGGDAWLPTVEQSYLYLEFGSGDIAGGTLEIIYDQLAVGVELPADLESI